MAATISFTPDWTSLPQHLLLSIANLLHQRIDILLFRAVCRSFRSTIPPPPKVFPFPQSLLTVTDFVRGPNPSVDDPFVFVDSTVYAIEALNGISNTDDETSSTWLVKVEESSKSGVVQLKNPLSSLILFGKRALKLPQPLNLLDYRVKEINKSYTAVLKGIYDLKVVFSSSLHETDDGFAVMAEYYSGTELFVWRNVDRKWNNVNLSLDDSFDHIVDIIYHNDKFYALLSTGRTVTVDSTSLTVTQVAAELEENLDSCFLCLVESLKDLFFLVYEEFYIKVFKIDEERREWVEVANGLELEDRVFFVAEGGSYSVSVKDFPKCKGNCVYFSAHDFDYTKAYSGEDAWIFHLEDGAVEKLSDSPGHFNVLWTPPTWFKQH